MLSVLYSEYLKRKEVTAAFTILLLIFALDIFKNMRNILISQSECGIFRADDKLFPLGISGSLEKSKELLELSLKIFECFAIRSRSVLTNIFFQSSIFDSLFELKQLIRIVLYSYGNMCTQCVTGVKVLIKKCEEFIKQMVPLKQITSTSITVRNVVYIYITHLLYIFC